jgi:hypothetical protein
MERAAPQDILRFEAVGIEPPFDNKEFALNKFHVVDLALINCGFSRV